MKSTKKISLISKESKSQERYSIWTFKKYKSMIFQYMKYKKKNLNKKSLS